MYMYISFSLTNESIPPEQCWTPYDYKRHVSCVFFRHSYRFPDDVEDAATVGIHTIEPCEYSHPAIPQIILCDFPGYDEYEYPNAETYWNHFELGKFKEFIFLTKKELTKYDFDLVEKMKSSTRSFIIIRTHIDEYFQSEGTSLKKEEQFEKIKKEITECIDCQQEQIFLINNYDTNDKDFLLAMDAVTEINVIFLGKVLNFNI